jgi:hypothetical protein
MALIGSDPEVRNVVLQMGRERLARRGRPPAMQHPAIIGGGGGGLLARLERELRALAPFLLPPLPVRRRTAPATLPPMGAPPNASAPAFPGPPPEPREAIDLARSRSVVGSYYRGRS